MKHFGVSSLRLLAGGEKDDISFVVHVDADLSGENAVEGGLVDVELGDAFGGDLGLGASGTGLELAHSCIFLMNGAAPFDDSKQG